MSDQRQMLESLINKYRDAVYGDNFWPQVHAIRDDLKFFQEYSDRFKKVSSFNYRISLSYRGLIYDLFFRQAQDFMQWETDKNIQTTLELFYLLMHLLDGWRNEKHEPQKDVVRDIILVDEVVIWFLGGNPYWYLSAFIGCNHEIEALKNYLGSLRGQRRMI